VELVKTLFAKGGIDPNDRVPGSQGGALLITIANPNIELATLLLENGADPNLGRGAALLSAISSGNFEMAALLLNHGANPNLGGPNGAALHALIRTDGGGDAPGGTGGKLNRMGLAAMLVAKGADVNGRGGSPPRGKTVSIGTALAALPKLANPDRSGGVTVLLSAAENADVLLLKFLLANGADPKLTSGGDNALMLAAGVGNNPSSNKESAVLEAVKILYEAGADVNGKDDNGDTAVHGAVLRGQNSVIQFLAERGAQLNEKNRIGWTPLDMAEGLFPGTPNYRPTHSAMLLKELLGIKEYVIPSR
jgi:ankyrin repeat protein